MLSAARARFLVLDMDQAKHSITFVGIRKFAKADGQQITLRRLIISRLFCEEKEISMSFQNKVNKLAQNIKNCVNVYGKFVGKTYLVVYNQNTTYKEIMFKNSNFKHLTGVGTVLSAESFYTNAINKTLMGSQLFFNANHPYKLCKNKIKCLEKLDQLLENDSIVVENITTNQSAQFKIGLTDLDFTLCFSENRDKNGNTINDILVPHSLRVKDDAFNLSENQYFVDCIFSKQNNEVKYTDVVFGQSIDFNELPKDVKDLIDIGY